MCKLMRRHRKKGILLLALLAGYIILNTAHKVTWVWEGSIALSREGLMPVLAFLPSWVSFSVAEWVVLLSIGGLIVFLVSLVVQGTKSAQKADFFYSRFLALLCVIASVGVLFAASWGISYHAPPLAEKLALEVKTLTADELYQVADILVDRLNTAALAVGRNDEGILELSVPKEELLKSALPIMQASGYPFLEGRYSCPKGLLSSGLFNYLGINGIYFPFTGEANLNMASHDLFLASSILHEMAHQRGIAREDEANFIAYLVGANSETPDFVYSAYVLAYTHLVNALSTADSGLLFAIVERENSFVRADFEDYREFQKQFATPVREVSHNVNDQFLKAQGQEQGAKSYGRMVDLLVAYLLERSITK